MRVTVFSLTFFGEEMKKCPQLGLSRNLDKAQVKP
jgi:hypothetical protein